MLATGRGSSLGCLGGWEDLGQHPAAYPEIIVTSSEKGDGLELLRAAVAGLVAK